MGIFKTSTITAALTLTAGAALAQDYWAGYYGGISIDAVRNTSKVQGSTVHSYKDKATSLGLYAGYNVVRATGFVWGPEIKLTGVSTSGRRSGDGFGDSTYDGGFLLTPRLRGGYATDKVFFYGILGLSFSDAMARPSGSSGTDISGAPSIGIGMEFAIGNDWSTKIEAVHHTFESTEFDFNGTTARSDNKLTQITLGLSRKF